MSVACTWGQNPGSRSSGHYNKHGGGGGGGDDDDDDDDDDYDNDDDNSDDDNDGGDIYVWMYKTFTVTPHTDWQ